MQLYQYELLRLDESDHLYPPIVLSARLKHRKVNSIQTTTDTIVSHDLVKVVIGRSNCKRIFPGTLFVATVTRRQVPDTARMFHNGQFVPINKAVRPLKSYFSLANNLN